MTLGENNGVLSLDGLNKMHWYDFILFSSNLPETVVKIPNEQFSNSTSR